MIRATILAGVALCAALPAHAQTTPGPVAPSVAPMPVPVPAVQHVQLTTSAGAIIIAVEVERAPITAANFLRYVDQRRLDGITIYRRMPSGDGGLIQGGTRGDRARVLRGIPHEPTTQTGLSHTDGAISMARLSPGTADGDFFIIVGDQMTGLDANPAAAGDNLGFAVFGRVVSGMEIVRGMLSAPTSPTEGEGIMRGQMLSPPIRIATARRVAATPPPAPASAPAPVTPPQTP